MDVPEGMTNGAGAALVAVGVAALASGGVPESAGPVAAAEAVWFVAPLSFAVGLVLVWDAAVEFCEPGGLLQPTTIRASTRSKPAGARKKRFGCMFWFLLPMESQANTMPLGVRTRN
jgi:hypothetical protein